ncbi:phytanoyl-CoA dioxygenase family protein [Exilibacterium tricleocarpae]|uniref:Phytanoyl-CoA dioxygenase family protein n=1 Tax=Exilibacterium tricleocarpae TaxID=2591008 RepID=A0A545T1S7_9GAMM|nr:phytanoyl-CoA dioxygenase family protein [Exilibacterium tricleocarpae]TQV71163.1 phytanoyl-CoA dioxygenase family protein [Exilibacterium tricleocarpae]
MKKLHSLGERVYDTYDVESYYGEEELRFLKKRLPLRVLSESDFAAWQRQGYVVIKQAVSRRQALATYHAMLDFAGLDPDNPAQWNDFPDFPTQQHKDLHVIGMIECYHHRTLWENRQTQRVYDAFVDIWDTHDLWVTLDRINLNPPNTGTRAINPFIHWDIDTTLTPLPQRVQGILVLNDNSQQQGGFQCVPTLYQEFDKWVSHQPDNRDRYVPELSAHHAIVVPEVQAGDLLIFNGLLPHGIAANRTRHQIRAVQYLSMMPAVYAADKVLADRLLSYQTLSTPTWDASLVGDPVLHEQQRYRSPALSALGQRLLGAQPW